MNRAAFAMPVNGWTGLYANQYIVQCYTLSFVPTLEFVEELNDGIPQGLRYGLGGLNGSGERGGGTQPGRVIVYATDPAWFEQYAEPALSKAGELVARMREQRAVEKWIA